MARLEHTLRLDRDALDRLRQPRTDLLIERADGPDCWTVERGPFRHYRRRLTVTETGADASAPSTVT